MSLVCVYIASELIGEFVVEKGVTIKSEATRHSPSEFLLNTCLVFIILSLSHCYFQPIIFLLRHFYFYLSPSHSCYRTNFVRKFQLKYLAFSCDNFTYKRKIDFGSVNFSFRSCSTSLASALSHASGGKSSLTDRPQLHELHNWEKRRKASLSSGLYDTTRRKRGGAKNKGTKMKERSMNTYRRNARVIKDAVRYSRPRNN